MQAQERYIRIEQACSTEIDGQLVILAIETGKYFSVSPTGKAIWDLLAAPSSADEVTAALCRRYAVAQTQCANETSQFMTLLEQKGLIQRSAS